MPAVASWIVPAFWAPSPWEWAIIAIVAVLLFGRKLPDLGRSLGRGIVEFKKGLSGIQDEIETAADEERARETKKTDEGAAPKSCAASEEEESDERKA